MDPLQAPALNALEPFLALCPSATSPRAAADLISRAIAAQGTFVFAELLNAPNIQALGQAGVDAQHARWLAALEIFSWGTWADYQGAHRTISADATRGEHYVKLFKLTVPSKLVSSSTLAIPDPQTTPPHASLSVTFTEHESELLPPAVRALSARRAITRGPCHRRNLLRCHHRTPGS